MHLQYSIHMNFKLFYLIFFFSLFYVCCRLLGNAVVSFLYFFISQNFIFPHPPNPLWKCGRRYFSVLWTWSPNRWRWTRWLGWEVNKRERVAPAYIYILYIYIEKRKSNRSLSLSMRHFLPLLVFIWWRFGSFPSFFFLWLLQETCCDEANKAEDHHFRPSLSLFFYFLSFCWKSRSAQ